MIPPHASTGTRHTHVLYIGNAMPHSSLNFKRKKNWKFFDHVLQRKLNCYTYCLFVLSLRCALCCHFLSHPNACMVSFILIYSYLSWMLAKCLDFLKRNKYDAYTFNIRSLSISLFISVPLHLFEWEYVLLSLRHTKCIYGVLAHNTKRKDLIIILVAVLEFIRTVGYNRTQRLRLVVWEQEKRKTMRCRREKTTNLQNDLYNKIAFVPNWTGPYTV